MVSEVPRCQTVKTAVHHDAQLIGDSLWHVQPMEFILSISPICLLVLCTRCVCQLLNKQIYDEIYMMNQLVLHDGNKAHCSTTYNAARLSVVILESPGHVLEHLLPPALPQCYDFRKLPQTRQIPNRCSYLTDCSFITRTGCCFLTLTD